MTIKLFSFSSSLKTLFCQLWLSVSSVKFYQEVYKLYNGYGIKYIFFVSFISSLLIAVYYQTNLINLKNAFNNNQFSQSKEAANLDYIIKQIPDIHYDSENITTQEETLIYLTDLDGQRIGAFDLNNQLSLTERNKLPVVFLGKSVIINFKNKTLVIPYTKLLANILDTSQAQTLTQDSIREYIADFFNLAPKIFCYLVMPFLIALRFFSILFERAFIIILIYTLTAVFGPKTPIKTCIRLTFFASGALVLVEPVIIFLPELYNIISFIQIWTNLLVFLGILKIRQQQA